MTPARIWVWPDQSATGAINWIKGCFRAEPHRPLDRKDGPSGEAYVHVSVADDLLAALEFYADKNGDGYDVMVTNYGLSTDEGPIVRDGGDIARAALVKARGQP